MINGQRKGDCGEARQKSRCRKNTLKDLARTYFEDPMKARGVIESRDRASTGASRSYQKISEPTPLSAEDGNTYSAFDPRHWDMPYSIFRVKLGQTRAASYFSYLGEAIVIPANGNVVCDHFYSGGRELPSESTLSVGPDSLLHLAATVPHNIRSDGSGGEAWMVVHRAAENPSYFPDPNGSASRLALGRIDARKLNDPAIYALNATGLSDKMHSLMAGSHMTIRELAYQVHADSVVISRLLDRNANVSLDLLDRVARILRFDLRSMLENMSMFPFAHEEPKTSPSHPHALPCKHPNGMKTCLHATRMRLDQESVHSLQPPDIPNADSMTMTSWLLLKGRVIFEEQAGYASSDMQVPAQVVHFRKMPKSVTAIDDSELIQISCSQGCPQAAGI
jgi:hypothetical protein